MIARFFTCPGNPRTRLPTALQNRLIDVTLEEFTGYRRRYRLSIRYEQITGGRIRIPLARPVVGSRESFANGRSFCYGGSWAKEVGDGSKTRTKKAEILRFGS